MYLRPTYLCRIQYEFFVQNPVKIMRCLRKFDKHDLSTLLLLSIESIKVYEKAYPILMENLNRLQIEHGHRSM